MAGRPSHPDRPKIEQRLREGASVRDILREFPDGPSERAIQGYQWALFGPAKRSRRTVTIKPTRRLGNPSSAFNRAERRAVALHAAPDLDPVVLEDLCQEALRALRDFGYFRQRYFGRVSPPWQIRAGETLVELLESPDDERVVINCPPGAGKSTLIHDLTCWMICRDRAVRVLIVSASQRLAEKYSLRVRKSLERRIPLRASAREKFRGLAVDAEATLAGDFGRFRPPSEGLWRKEEFVVEQLDGESLENKEPTVAAYGLDSDVIGHRADAVLPDDVATTTNSKEGQERTALFEKWEVIENRVEPGGLLAVTGQRLTAVDLSQHCLDQLSGDVDDEDEAELGRLSEPVYRHIVYKAYYPELDTGPESRSPEALSWPEGPLLDPKRVTWRKLANLKRNKPETFATQYQQERGAKTENLVQELWVEGGIDEMGTLYPGCVDMGRRLWQVPSDRSDPLVSVASVDPSGTKYWAFVWKLYEPEADLRHVVGLYHGRMAADSVLSWDFTRHECVGLMVDWQLHSIKLGRPITHWVIEKNFGRHFLDMAPIAEFETVFRTKVVEHTTHRYNKDHADIGIQVLLPPIWRQGRIRLPDRADPEVERFVQEHLTWRSERRTEDDFVLADWFPETRWPELVPPRSLPKLSVPDWVTREAAVA